MTRCEIAKKIKWVTSVACSALLISANLINVALAAPLDKIGAGEGRVDIIAWPGYIERGETDKDYDWVTDFEAKTGCKVTVKTAATSDEMVTLMNQGGFDLVTASGDASNRLIAGNKVQPINLSLIPNFKLVDSRMQNQPWYVVDKQVYGVPYQWGWNVLLYNAKVFGDKRPTSWSVVFEEQTLPDGKSNKGRVQAYDGAIYIADAALYLMAKKPELGIKNPYELNEKQYQAVIELLKKQRQLVGRYWHDATVQVEDFTNEGVVASSSWSFQANTLMANKQPVDIVVPVEGATGWADTTMLHANAKNPNCAYMWMNHSLQAKVQMDVSEWFGSVPVTPAACAGDRKAICVNQGLNDFDKIWFWRTSTKQCATQNNECVPYSRWVTDYISVLGSK